MTQAAWDDSWDTDGNAMISITSFAAPSGSRTFWGGPDGVQEEPLAVWAGNSEAAAKKVTVLRVVNEVYRIVWRNWALRIVYDYPLATSSENSQAVNNARRYLGAPYCQTAANIILNKGPANASLPQFVCSSLVWKAWKDVGNDLFYRYELDATWWDLGVTPHNIYTAADTRAVGSYTN